MATDMRLGLKHVLRATLCQCVVIKNKKDNFYNDSISQRK